jgi:hypothetical protein
MSQDDRSPSPERRWVRLVAPTGDAEWEGGSRFSVTPKVTEMTVVDGRGVFCFFNYFDMGGLLNLQFITNYK